MKRLTYPKKSIIATFIILVIIFTSYSLFFLTVNAHPVFLSQKRYDVGFVQGMKICQTDPITVYNIVNSNHFLKHTLAFRPGYHDGLVSGNCDNWAKPGGPQAQSIVHTLVGYGKFSYTNINPEQLISGGVPNLLKCASNILTCVDRTGHFINNW